MLRFQSWSAPGCEQAAFKHLSRQPMPAADHIIGCELDGQSVTLEPGGQFELSGAPVSTLHETCAEVNQHLQQVWAATASTAQSARRSNRSPPMAGQLALSSICLLSSPRQFQRCERFLEAC